MTRHPDRQLLRNRGGDPRPGLVRGCDAGVVDAPLGEPRGNVAHGVARERERQRRAGPPVGVGQILRLELYRVGREGPRAVAEALVERRGE